MRVLKQQNKKQDKSPAIKHGKEANTDFVQGKRLIKMYNIDSSKYRKRNVIYKIHYNMF